MAQQHSTRIHPGSAGSDVSPAPPPKGEGLDVQTLLLSAIASAVSAYVTSKVWAAGTLWAAAMSPVIVALVKEGLRRPAEVVTAAVPTPRVPSPRVRTTRPAARATSTRHEPLPDDLTDRLDAGAPPPFPPPAAGAPAGPVRVYSTKGRRLRWRLAVVTGLLGFGICVLVYTVPEVIAGRSVVHSADKTTFWGGSRHRTKDDAKPAGTTTTGAPARTTTTPAADQPATTVTAPPQTVTVAPPTATAPPAQTAPPQTTPAPVPAEPGGTATAPAG